MASVEVIEHSQPNGAQRPHLVVMRYSPTRGEARRLRTQGDHTNQHWISPSRLHEIPVIADWYWRHKLRAADRGEFWAQHHKSSIHLQVGASGDDAYWTTGGSFNDTNAAVFVASTNVNTFARFTGVSGLHGVTWSSGSLQVHGYSNFGVDATVNCLIKFELADTPAAPTSASDADGRSKTSGTAWNAMGWTSEDWNTSVDITSELQALTDAQDPADITCYLMWVANDYVGYTSYDHDPTQAIKLDGVYTNPGTVVTPGVASLATAGFAPTVAVSANQSPIPSVAALTLATFAPTLSMSGGAILVTPPIATLTLTTFAPGDGSLMASPPTMTYGTATVLSSPIKQAPILSYFANLGHRLGLEHFNRYTGLSTTPNFNNYEDNGDNLNMTPFSIEFDFTGRVVEFEVTDNLARYRLLVDGKWATATEQAIEPYGSATYQHPYYLSFDFGSSATRRIRLETNNVLCITAVMRESGDSFAATGLNYGPRVIVLGDSYTEGQYGDPYAQNTLLNWVYRLQHQLEGPRGWKDVWASGSGGTGILNTSGGQGRVKFRDRLASDVSAYSPDVVIIAGGFNDTLYTQSAIQAEANLLYAAAKTQNPGATIIAIGPWTPTGVTSTGTVSTLGDIRDALKAAASSQHVWFVDPADGQIYNPLGAAHGSALGQWITTATAAIFTSPDNVHPTLPGHARLGDKAAEATNLILDSLVLPPSRAVVTTPYAPTITILSSYTAIPPTASLAAVGLAPVVIAAASQTVIPAVASLTLAGLAPVLAGATIPDPAALALTAFAPSLVFGIVPGVASLSLASFAPALDLAVTPQPASLALATTTAIIALAVTPDTATATTQGYAPTLALALIPGPASLALASFAADVLAPNNVAVVTPLAQLATQAFAPVIAATGNVVAEPGPASLSTATFAATVQAGASQTVTPDLAAPLALATFAATVVATANMLVVPGPAALAFALFSPSVSVSVDVAPASLTLATFAPIALAPNVAIPDPAALILTGYAPAAARPGIFEPDPAALTTAAFAPPILISDTVTPGLAALVLATFAPVVDTGIVPPTAALVITTYGPGVLRPVVVEPSATTITTAAFAPAVITTEPQTVTPDPAALTLATFAPAISIFTPAIFTPDPAAVVLATYAPLLSFALAVVVPGPAGLFLHGFAPGVFAETPDLVIDLAASYDPVIDAAAGPTIADLGARYSNPVIDLEASA